MEKPFCLHFMDRRKIINRLPKNATVLNEHHGGWMIVRLPGLTWDAAMALFRDDALVGICEQKEYLNDEKIKTEPHKIDAALPTPTGCGKRGCVV